MGKKADSSNEPKKKIEALLSQKAKAAADNVVAADGTTQVEEVRELLNLARLVKVLQLVQPEQRRKRWPLVVMICATLIVVSLLLFLRVRKTEIELDVIVSEVSFVLSREEAVTSSFGLATLGVSGFSEVQLPIVSKDGAAESLMLGEEDKAVRLTAVASVQPAGVISLGRMILPAGTLVRLRRAETQNQYHLSIELPQGSEIELRADATGTIEVTSNAPSATLRLASPKAFTFTFGSPEANLDLTLRDDAASPFATNLAIKDPSFLAFEEIVDVERTLGRQVPTILSGSVYYQELDGQERQLRGSEGLQLHNCKGELRAIEIAPKGLRFRFVGEVSGIDKGLAAYKTNIMPTYLEWIRANHGLALLWGTTLYLFSLGVGLLRWWGWI